ncbi:hypothetical protein GF314_14570 [bacterium]|nr:hypothetical protein [bacterium]
MERLHIRRAAIATLAATVLMIGLAPATAAAAEPDWNRLDDPLQGGIGIHAGHIGGTGLAFKWPLRWYLQLQVAGGLWHTDDSQLHNIGVELQYLLRQDPRLRLFLLTGWRYANDRDKVTDAAGESWEDDAGWATGFGVGVEYLIGMRWSVKADVDFTYRQSEESITLWPQAGLFFYW